MTQKITSPHETVYNPKILRKSKLIHLSEGKEHMILDKKTIVNIKGREKTEQDQFSDNNRKYTGCIRNIE